MSNERDLHLRVGEFAQLHANTPLQLKHARAIFKALAASIGAHVEERLATLTRRIQALEQKPSIQYCGTYEPGRSYSAGNAITHKGSLWIATAETSSPPSFDGPSDWKLAAKKGRDSRDPKDRAA